MNGTRLALSLVLLAMPALSMPAVRRTRSPRTWALLLTVALGGGFVLLETSLIHAALPLGFDLLGLDQLADVCRSMGGHLFGDPTLFSAVSGILAAVIAGQAGRGVVATLKGNSFLRRTVASQSSTSVAGHSAVVLPMRKIWAVAIPGGPPKIALSSDLFTTLKTRELAAVMEHEIAHLRHHHVRYLLLGTAVRWGLWFVPWTAKGYDALRLALERWADELASASSGEARKHVRSAIRKLASITPSTLARQRLAALDATSEASGPGAWVWPTAASATLPITIAMLATFVVHLSRVLTIAG